MVIKHYELKASQLRDGHLLQIGSSTNYVLVADAKPETDGRIAIWIYDGDDQRTPGVRLRLEPDAMVSVSTASPLPVRLHADDWEDILDAVGQAACSTENGIDCADCRQQTSGCDVHAAAWSQVDRWRALAPRVRDQIGHARPGKAKQQVASRNRI